MKRYLLLSSLVVTSMGAFAQSAIDAYQFSQSDLKGTARFMSMGGAFGALGADLSTLSQNPGGIGVYRGTDIGFTLDLDCQSSSSTAGGLRSVQDQTKLLLNNIGVVATYKMDGGLKNLNFGFTYQKAASFNRWYGGRFPNISTSLTNYIAGVSNANDLTIGDVRTSNSYDPYNPNDGGYVSPWISILGYYSYLANPEEVYDEKGEYVRTDWYGQMGEGTSGDAWYTVDERGGVDEYNISFGGNIQNVVFWGMDFGIIDFNYTAHTYYGENLTGAWLPDNNDQLQGGLSSKWDLYNYYNVNGNGFNYKLGFIVKPIQELRFGFAFHTPTWYSFTQNYYADVAYNYDNFIPSGTAETNGGYNATSNFNFRTPWKLIFSAATVQPLMSGLIVSADYEWQPYNGMHFSDPYAGPSYGVPMNQPYYYENQDIANYYKQTNTLRLGAELRVTPQFSVRAGYCYVSSPVRQDAKSGDVDIYTAGTRPQFTWDDDTNYLTCGLGYRYKYFYADAAYVYKNRKSTYHAFEDDPGSGFASPTASVNTSHSQIVLSLGFKF